jgi:hypothetical protein
MLSVYRAKKEFDSFYFENLLLISTLNQNKTCLLNGRQMERPAPSLTHFISPLLDPMNGTGQFDPCVLLLLANQRVTNLMEMLRLDGA